MASDFTKPAKTFEKQVQLLQSRGMIIGDVQGAIFYLQHLNYYRLSAYWLPFELDHMEVSVRSQWAYQLAILHNPHAHLDSQLFNPRYWQRDLKALSQEVDRSQETFIHHLQNTYNEQLPPVWAVCEVMSIGLLSRWYSSLKPYKTRSAIARVYQINDLVLASWIHYLSIVRIFCAHHSRLWNQEFSIIPALPKSKNNAIASQLVQGSRNLYNTLVILLYFMDTIAPNYHLRSRPIKLLSARVRSATEFDVG